MHIYSELQSNVEVPLLQMFLREKAKFSLSCMVKEPYSKAEELAQSLITLYSPINLFHLLPFGTNSMALNTLTLRGKAHFTGAEC